MYTSQQQYDELIKFMEANDLRGRYLSAPIQEEIYAVYGLVPLAEVPESVLWAIVGKYELGVERTWHP